MKSNYQRLAKSLQGLDFQICFANKANSNIAILRHFATLGCAFEFASAGELQRVIAAGSNVKNSVFAGVGKTEAEIRVALQHEIYCFHVESEPELERINRVAGELGVMAPIAIRVNPDVDAHTHEKISTGKSEHKFGIPLQNAGLAYEAASKYPNLILKGIQMHIGSQITEVGPIKSAIEKVAPFAIELKQKYGITHFSIGGGLGIVYPQALESGDQSWWDAQPINSRPLTPEAYGAAVVPLLQPLGLKIILEPGRYLVGNAGVLVSRVEYVKQGLHKNFLILDAGMNDLVRPAMYDAHHQVVPLLLDDERSKETVDVVGPVCETSDCFAKDRSIQEVKQGEFIAIMSAGAYGKTMASRYNSRGLAAEVLVYGKQHALIFERESFDQIIALERIP